LIRRNSFERSRFGQFYIIVAYRHLLAGNWTKVFESLDQGMEIQKGFGLKHSLREIEMMKGWIMHALGPARESLEMFKRLYETARTDGDDDCKLWGALGIIANSKWLGDFEKGLEWIQIYNTLVEEAKENEHQATFLIGFKAILLLRVGLEDGALEVASQGRELLKKTVNSGMPHNVLPLQNILEVHLALLEKYQKMEGEYAESLVCQILKECQEELEMMHQSVILFSIMRPMYYLYHGRFIYLTTRNAQKAINYFKTSAEDSKKYSLGYLQALSLFEWARVSHFDSVERIDKLEEALNIFSELEAMYEEQLTRAEIKKKEHQYVDRLFTVNYHELS